MCVCAVYYAIIINNNEIGTLSTDHYLYYHLGHLIVSDKRKFN